MNGSVPGADHRAEQCEQCENGAGVAAHEMVREQRIRPEADYVSSDGFVPSGAPEMKPESKISAFVAVLKPRM